MISGGTEVEQPTQTHPTPSATSINDLLQKLKNTPIYKFYTTGSSIPLLLEFFERIEIFLKFVLQSCRKYKLEL